MPNTLETEMALEAHLGVPISKVSAGARWVFIHAGPQPWLTNDLARWPGWSAAIEDFGHPSYEVPLRDNGSEKWVEQVLWIVENIRYGWCSTVLGQFVFEDEADAVLFKLRFK